jgi:DNA gyrase/topoisomerase IV subunit B
MTKNEFNPDWDAMAVIVEEQQRMAKRIEELTQLVTSQDIRLMDAEAQSEQEPVAAFAKKEWINLTVQEREKIRDEYGDNPSGLISVVQMILKEKNYE